MILQLIKQITISAYKCMQIQLHNILWNAHKCKRTQTDEKKRSYRKHFAGIIVVVHISAVMEQMWTELVKALAKAAILQMEQQGSTTNKVKYD